MTGTQHRIPFQDLVSDRNGGAAIVFALALPAMLGVIGGAVDYASFSRQRQDVQNVADSTALSVARQMTMSRLSDTQVQAAAQSFAGANGLATGLPGLHVTAILTADRLGVRVQASAKAKTTLGIVPQFAGIETINSSATARVGQQTKLCLLSVANSSSNEIKGGVFVTRETTGINIQNDARLTAPDCLLHTNIAGSEALTIGSGSKITAGIVCAVGGIRNMGGTVEAAVLDSCPNILNPMDKRIYPHLKQRCNANQYNDVVITSGTHTLFPRNYCGDITISGDAKVRLSPGNYSIQGNLVVRGNAELTGTGVALYLFGGDASLRKRASFAFLEHALIDLSAPETGEMAGIVIWEGINGAAFDQLTNVVNGNYHQINTTRARRLTGTIYLPGGRLLIDAPVRVAEESDYTVLVVNRLDLRAGPNLVLNSNYAKSRVPVPQGLGPIGAKNVRLER